MRFRKLLILAALAPVAMLTASMAASQTPPAPAGPAANDPNKANYPDPTHIPFILPENIPWTGTAGKEQQYLIMGDTKKPGPYILLLKWWPGSYSKPHFHDKARFITVISGHWWVSSSNHYDPTKTYPLPPGTLAQDALNTVHWDGAKDEPVVLEIVGDGPVPNINVGEDGKPLGKANF